MKTRIGFKGLTVLAVAVVAVSLLLAGASLAIGEELAPVITKQPVSETLNVGSTAHTLVVEGTVPASGTLSYQWYANSKRSATDGSAIAGAVYSSYLPPSNKPGTVYYYCVLTNTDGEGVRYSTVSDIATVVVRRVVADTPVIKKQPKAKKVLRNRKCVLRVSATVAQGKLTYQWYRNRPQNERSDVKIKGATKASYKVSTKYNSSYRYYCVITNTDSSAVSKKTVSLKSSAAKVTVYSKWKKINKIYVWHSAMGLVLQEHLINFQTRVLWEYENSGYPLYKERDTSARNHGYTYVKRLRRSKIKTFMKKAKKYKLHHWERYYINSSVMDGHQWGMTIYYADGTKARVFGSNKLPKTYLKMRKAFKQLTGKDVLLR